jgi:hypothetical protein
MRIWGLMLVGLVMARPAAGQGIAETGALSCWRSGAQATTSCVRKTTARVARGELSRTEVLEMLGVGGGVASGAAVADFLVELARSRDLDEVEQTAYISLAGSLPGDRNRERALAYLAANEPLSAYNREAMLGATLRISAPRLRWALLAQIARSQPVDLAVHTAQRRP